MPASTSAAGGPLSRLFDPRDVPGLGPAVRATALDAVLIGRLVDEALHGAPVTAAVDPGLRRDRLLALALCWHDRWDAAHQVCVAGEGDQDLDLVHQVLHRREPDAANCRYWIRETGWHPAYDRLPPLVRAAGQEALLSAGKWDAERFMVRCHAATAADRAALERVQAHELGVLLDLLLRDPPLHPA